MRTIQLAGTGGVLPFIISVFADLSALGSLAGGVSLVA